MPYNFKRLIDQPTEESLLELLLQGARSNDEVIIILAEAVRQNVWGSERLADKVISLDESGSSTVR